MTTNALQKWVHTAASIAQQYGARRGIQLNNVKALGGWVYIVASVLAAVWTLVMWGVYALLGLSDEALSAGSQFFTIDAQILEWLTSFVGGTQQLGESLVLVVWMLGLALLVLAGWLGRRLIRAFSNAAASRDDREI